VLPLSFLPSMILANAGEDDKKDEVGKDFSRLGFFATGTLGRGKRDNTAQTPGFDFDTYGMTAGIDYRYSDSFVFGVALGYNHNTTDISRDRGGLDVTGWSVSGYGTYYRGESFYADVVASIGRNNFDLERRIRYSINAVNGGVTNVDQLVKASPDGDQNSFGLSLGRDFNRGAWSFGPYGRLTYARVSFDNYTERASDPSAPGAGLVVSVDGREITSLQGVVGGKVSWTHSVSWGVLIPHVQGEWLHEFRDDPVQVVSFFANDPTRTPIVIPGERVDPDYFNLGFGLSAILPNGKSGFIYYEHRAGERRLTQDSIALGLRLEF
jgi:outer membrane autotransporter protein